MARLARLAYPEMDTRVQPLPNVVDEPVVYQVHIRAKRAQTRDELDWKLVEQGYSDQLEKNLRFKANHG